MWNSLNDNSRCFLRLLSEYLRQQKSEDAPLNDEVRALAKSHEVEGVIYYQTRDARLLPSYAKAVTMHVNRTKLMQRAEKALQDAGVDYYVVKGAVTSELYPQPALRTMSDCDFLIHTEDRENVRSILTGLGMLNYGVVSEYEWCYHLGELEIEVHDHLLYYDAINSDAEKRLMDKAWEYVEGHRLSPEFHFVYLLSHAKKHLMECGIGMRQFMDLAAEIQHREMDADRLASLLEEAELMPFACTCLSLCKEWFDIDVPFSRELDETFVAHATDAILRGGVFGFDNEEWMERRTTAKVAKTGKWRLVLRRLFPSYRDCHFVKEYSYVDGRPWLLPVVWIHRLFRMVFSRRMKETAKSELAAVTAVSGDALKEEFARWGIDTK